MLVVCNSSDERFDIASLKKATAQLKTKKIAVAKAIYIHQIGLFS
jgi:hypothetical protein